MFYNTDADDTNIHLWEQTKYGVRFEVSTAVTMMIIISQKMIIIKPSTGSSSC
jgi:hypothetical protein